MKKISIGHLAALCFLCVLLVGCTFTNNDCDSNQLVAPQAFSPSDELVPSLQPVIEWFYPEDCTPDSYRLEIAVNGDFTAPTVIVETVTGSQVPHTLTQSLQPATLYEWRVAAEIGGDTGDYSPSPAFWTGPLCQGVTLNPPVLIDPPYGGTVQDDSPMLVWEYSNFDCIPEGYHFEVASDIQFTDIKLSGDGLGPWTSFDTNVPYIDDCGLYFWSVAATNSTASSATNTSLFYSDFNSQCPQYSCSAADLVPPDPLYPIGGATVVSVDDPFRFQWAYNDPNCIPDGYYFEVYSGVDFLSTPPGHGFALDTRVPGWGPLPELPSYVMLPDCTTFKWHVAAEQGTETGPFSIEATFTTDYAGTCGPATAQGVSWIGMACLNEDRMMVTFEFPEPPKGGYQARVGTRSFDCQVSEEVPTRLYCFGPLRGEDILEAVTLANETTGETAFVGDISILCPEEEEKPEDGPPPCGSLDAESCKKRADCDWIPVTGGLCVPK
jgi:hypothetical protein